VKKTVEILKALFDFVLPESRYGQIASRISTEKLNIHTRPRYILEDNIFVLFRLQDPFIKKSIWALKYHNHPKIADIFGSILYEHIIGELSDSLLFEDFKEQATKRAKAALVSRTVAAEQNISIDEDELKKGCITEARRARRKAKVFLCSSCSSYYYPSVSCFSCTFFMLPSP